MSIELKIKACSLAAEAVIIKRLEKRAKRAWQRRRTNEKARDAFWLLRHHRTEDVRDAARSTHLARAFIKGVQYSHVECFAYSKPDFEAVEKMAVRYGGVDPRETQQKFAAWVHEASDYFVDATIKHDEALRAKLRARAAAAAKSTEETPPESSTEA